MLIGQSSWMWTGMELPMRPRPQALRARDGEVVPPMP